MPKCPKATPKTAKIAKIHEKPGDEYAKQIAAHAGNMLCGNATQRAFFNQKRNGLFCIKRLGIFLCNKQFFSWNIVCFYKK